MISPSTRTSKSWQTSHDASSYSSAQVRPPPAGPSTGVDLTSSAQFSIGAGRSSGGIAPNGVEQAYQHNIKSAPDPAMTERSWRVGAEQKERAGIDEQGQEPPRRKRSRGSSSPGSTSRPSTRRQPSSAQPSARDSSSRRYTSPSLSTRSSSPMPPEPKEKSGAAAGTASSGAEPDVTKGEEMCVDTSEQLEARRYSEFRRSLCPRSTGADPSPSLARPPWQSRAVPSWCAIFRRRVTLR